MKALTKKQEQVLRYIQTRQDTDRMTPTFREIATHFGFASANAALAHVQALIKKGVLKHLSGRARSLQISNPEAPQNRLRTRIVPIPIFGTIPAGTPREAEQEQEGCILMDVETLGVKPGARTFGLKVKGESMLGKCIMDGDVAVIDQGVQPRPGDVVAALIDGEVTLKSLVVQRGKAYLRAENPRYPSLIPREQLEVQGVMVALIRRRK